MKYLKTYEKYSFKENTLYIFDFDDTLVESPRFENS